MPAIITFTTDFGLTDPWVGIVKGVILGRCPTASVVDLTHGVPPQDLRTGAVQVGRAWPWFPPGTVHLVVVDPGVGSARRILAIEHAGQRFVGPDNGILPLAIDWAGPPLSAEAGSLVVAADRPDLRGNVVSATFHGRDVLAPYAAFLAGGGAVADLGPAITDWKKLPVSKATRHPDGSLRGSVVTIDRFGNLLTDLDGAQVGDTATIRVGEATIHGWRTCYAAAARGELLAVIGSDGRLEIAVRDGSAAQMLRVAPGVPVVVTG